MVVHSPTSSDDEKTGCAQDERLAILASIRGRVIHDTLTKMVANEPIEEPLLLQAIEGGDYGHGEEGEGSGSTMEEGFPNMEVPRNPFEKNCALGIRIGNFEGLCRRIQVEESRVGGGTCGPKKHGVTSKWQPNLGSRSD